MKVWENLKQTPLPVFCTQVRVKIFQTEFALLEVGTVRYLMDWLSPSLQREGTSASLMEIFHSLRVLLLPAADG